MGELPCAEQDTRVGNEFNTIGIEPLQGFLSLIDSDTVPADSSQERMTDLRPNMLWCEKPDPSLFKVSKDCSRNVVMRLVCRLNEPLYGNGRVKDIW